MAGKFDDDIIEELLERLEKGEGLATICRDKHMPSARTAFRWARGNDELATRIIESREIGYYTLAEQTLREVQECEDPIKARVLLDARRWHLGKLSMAFAEKPVAIGVALNVDAGDAFAAITGALDRAATAIAGRSTSTSTVVVAGPSGSGDTARRLADLAGSGGERLGQDAHGS